MNSREIDNEIEKLDQMYNSKVLYLKCLCKEPNISDPKMIIRLKFDINLILEKLNMMINLKEKYFNK
jgi:hypothetical protein